MHLYNRCCLVKNFVHERRVFHANYYSKKRQKHFFFVCVGFRRRVCPSLILIFFVFVSVMCFYLSDIVGYICCVWMFGIIFREFFVSVLTVFLRTLRKTNFSFSPTPRVFFFEILLEIIRGGKMKRRNQNFWSGSFSCGELGEGGLGWDYNENITFLKM